MCRSEGKASLVYFYGYTVQIEMIYVARCTKLSPFFFEVLQQSMISSPSFFPFLEEEKSEGNNKYELKHQCQQVWEPLRRPMRSHQRRGKCGESIWKEQRFEGVRGADVDPSGFNVTVYASALSVVWEKKCRTSVRTVFHPFEGDSRVTAQLKIPGSSLVARLYLF